MQLPQKRMIAKGILAVVGLLCFRGFFDASSLYGDFQVAYGIGIFNIHWSELVFYSWFLFFGIFATLALTGAMHGTKVPAAIERVMERMFSKPKLYVALLSILVFAFSALFRRLVLLDGPIADDESTYTFIAKTLLQGRLTNPVPKDQTFFANQFVVINDHGWFGKYPLGYPLLLAVGELLGAPHLVGPLLTALTLVFTYKIGEKLYGGKTALVGTTLLILSPHLLWTGATLLSQTASTLFLVAGVWSYLCFRETKRVLWGFVCGLLFAYGAVVRPLPGALFLVAFGLVALFQSDSSSFGARFKTNLRLFIPTAVFGAAALAFLLFVNHLQTGSASTSGYHAAHGADMGIGHVADGQVALSVASSLLRQNFWTFGWPLSLAFVFFAARRPGFGLMVSLIAAEYLYRVIAPKTVVASTGPIYVTEIVPLLALMSASGMIEVKRRLEERGFARAKSAVVAFAAASTAAALLLFWPVEITNLRSSAVKWRAPQSALEAQGIQKALIFADKMVVPEAGTSWAAFPPNPSPTLDDDLLFVRIPKNAKDAILAMREFHHRRFPDRPAFVLSFEKGEATLTALE